MNWKLSNRADKRALPLANRHYTRQKPESDQFLPPGRCLVLLTEDEKALWVTSWPLAEWTKHMWAGAWMCSMFRNEGKVLSSELIIEAVAATRWYFGHAPALGMVTFVDGEKTKKGRGKKEQPGNTFRAAGFERAQCPLHYLVNEAVEDVIGLMFDCAACRGETKDQRLTALQLLPENMPAALAPLGAQFDLF